MEPSGLGVFCNTSAEGICVGSVCGLFAPIMFDNEAFWFLIWLSPIDCIAFSNCWVAGTQLVGEVCDSVPPAV
jgi:hypothetical protein